MSAVTTPSEHRPTAWARLTRVLPWTVDAAAMGAVGVFALADLIASGGSALVLLVLAAGVVSVALTAARRWAALPAAAVAATGLLVGTFVVRGIASTPDLPVLVPTAPLVALAVLIAPVVRHESLPAASAMTAYGAAAVLTSTLGWPAGGEIELLFAIAFGGAFVGGAVVGGYLRHLDDRNVAAAEAARRDERLDMARELHDLVAHYVTGIVVQAQAARVVSARDPEAAAVALDRIEHAGRDALGAMRGMVGSLRGDEVAGDEDTAAPTAPTVGLAGLADLVGRSDAVGLPVEVDVSPEAAAVARGAVAVAVHRIVQEALTNVHRHAHDATHARVDVDRDAAALVLTVVDDGHPGVAGDATAGVPGPGFGLIGMGERAEALGGHLEAGPLAPPDRGWRVRAVLPLDDRRTA